jgi:hypothetical protein
MVSPPQDDPRRTDNENRGSYPDTTRPNDTEPLIITIEPQTKQKYSYEAKSYRLERARYRLEKKAYGVAHYTMVFLVVYTLLTLIVAISSVVATAYAKRSTDAAKEAVKLAKRNAHLEQRAWVSVSDITPSSKSITPWEISIIFKNSGRTPAQNFAIKLAGEPVAKGKSPVAEEKAKPGRGIIPPDGIFHSGLKSKTVYDWNIFDLVVHGEITYDSVFGNSHWTKFCYYFVPESTKSAKGNFAPCDTGNDIDSNEP